MENQMPLSDVQIEVSNDPSRFKVVVAGRRWGKTYLCMHEMAKAARHPGAKVFYVAPTYKMCKQIIWDDLKEKFIRCRWAKKINESITPTLLYCIAPTTNPQIEQLSEQYFEQSPTSHHNRTQFNNG